MEGYKPCQKCGLNYSERHHIIFKSSAKYMENVPSNIVYLCQEHHRGNHSPHKNDRINKEYKIDYKHYLESLFTKEKYTLEEISELLKIDIKEANRVTKTLSGYSGYKAREIIKHCLGGGFYDISNRSRQH